MRVRFPSPTPVVHPLGEALHAKFWFDSRLVHSYGRVAAGAALSIPRKAQSPRGFSTRMFDQIFFTNPLEKTLHAKKLVRSQTRPLHGREPLVRHLPCNGRLKSPRGFLTRVREKSSLARSLPAAHPTAGRSERARAFLFVLFRGSGAAGAGHRHGSYPSTRWFDSIGCDSRAQSPKPYTQVGSIPSRLAGKLMVSTSIETRGGAQASLLRLRYSGARNFSAGPAVSSLHAMRNSSPGRASDSRSEGSRFKPCFRNPRARFSRTCKFSSRPSRIALHANPR